ncbi:hypothetical protein [Spirilliplanes yamanashiensis]|uniref:Uncharacterized protein n=1 Tax=Spirilliplanes yamanashiensis TaxID=42233 RepID=A0A8J3YBC7_9ACTN|nr:hypothetical protein [Spirilliplanes yamanashiensis]MDP9818978.1 hypothetical protein [Spirilliplanes yamanashiensis]GIJ05433.1 hypothetical protein Sya03_47850 [Spirilliplanes yamanashiensis]
MSIATALNGLRADLDAHRARRDERRRLERELAGYTTPAELAELEMLMSRHSAEDIREMEEILQEQAARRRSAIAHR